MLRNKNSSNTALAAGASFVGTWESIPPDASITVALLTDAECDLFVEFSPDGVNTDSSLQYDVSANINEVHRIVITREYFRVRVLNGSDNQTFLRLQTRSNGFNLLSSPLNLSIGQDADAIITRSISEEYLISESKLTGVSVVNKFGRNADNDTGSVPEDVWNGGGIYAGFPTGAAEEFEAFSSNPSDTGVLTFQYLPSFTATSWLAGSVTLNGTTAVSTGISGVRIHSTTYNSNSPTGFNVGEITIRHKTTIANVFCRMPIGRSQTYVAAYTVPYGHIGIIRRMACYVLGSSTATVEGALWVRDVGSSPRLRRPFIASISAPFEEKSYAGLRFNALTDIIGRIISTSANNTDVVFAFDLIIIKQ